MFALSVVAGTYQVVSSRAVNSGAAPDAVASDPQAEPATFDELLTQIELEASSSPRFVQLPPAREAIRTYFDMPLSAARMAWVIDGSDRVAPVFDDVISLTKTASLQLDPTSQSFGVVVASKSDPLIQSINVAGASTYIEAKALMSRHSPAGTADLSRGFAAAVRQRPDVVFVVTARPLSRDEARDMKQRALAAGVVANVIALGGDDRLAQGLAAATSGRYASLDRQQLSAWRDLIASGKIIHRLEKERILGGGAR